MHPQYPKGLKSERGSRKEGDAGGGPTLFKQKIKSQRLNQSREKDKSGKTSATFRKDRTNLLAVTGGKWPEKKKKKNPKTKKNQTKERASQTVSRSRDRD